MGFWFRAMEIKSVRQNQCILGSHINKNTHNIHKTFKSIFLPSLHLPKEKLESCQSATVSLLKKKMS